MAFDPDKYIQEKQSGFDPDLYLKEKEAETSAPQASDMFSSDPKKKKALAMDIDRKAGKIRPPEYYDMGSFDQIKYDITHGGKSSAAQGEGQAALEGAGQGILMGYLPQAQAATRPFFKSVYEDVTGEKVPDRSYVEARDRNIARQDKLAKENPKAYYGAGALGALGSGIVTAPISGSARLVKALPGVVSKAPVIGNAIKGAIFGAEAGLLANPGDVEGVVNPIQGSERIEKGLSGARTGALLGGGIETAVRGVKAAPAIGKKALTVMFGPNREAIDYYLKNSKAVNAAGTLEELKIKVDEITKNLHRDIESGKITKENAQNLLSGIENEIKQTSAQNKLNFDYNTRDIKRDFDTAKKSLSEAYEKEVQKLKDVKAPTHLADDVTQATHELKDKIVEGSEFAKEALVGKGKVNLFESFKKLEQSMKSMNIAGKGPVTPQAKAAAKTIGELRQSLGNLPAKVSFQDAKKLIQQIDRSEKAIYNSPDFTDDVSRAFKDLRRAVDAQLKAANPEYAKRMEPVARMAGLHSEVAGKFGDKGKALSTLNRIGNTTSEVEQGLLRSLGRETGRDYEKPLAEYLVAQSNLKNPEALKILESNLPEYQKVKELEKLYAQASDPRYREQFLSKEIESSGLLDAKKSAQGLLDKETKFLENAEEKVKPLKGLSEGNSESRIRALMGPQNKNFEIRKQFEELSRLSDTDFVKAINDLRNKQAFEGGRPIGSRNTNLFAIVGGAIGGATGGPSGAGIGAGLGASLGGTVDKFGGVIAKRILDGVIKMGENPTVQKIRALEIPEEAKVYLMQSLNRYKATN